MEILFFGSYFEFGIEFISIDSKECINNRVYIDRNDE